jgi:hypothetical protein
MSILGILGIISLSPDTITIPVRVQEIVAELAATVLVGEIAIQTEVVGEVKPKRRSV